MNMASLLPKGVEQRPGAPRDDNVSVPMTPIQKARYQRLCAEMRVSMGALARSLIEQWMDEVQSHLDAQANKRAEEQTNVHD